MLVENVKVRWNYEGKNTTCVVSQNDEILMSKTITRFSKDLPNKRLARKVAFKKAMSLIAQGDILNKQMRGAIWNQFRTTIKQPILN